MVQPAFVLSEGFISTIFLFLGVGILLPWNAYISAKQYFVSRFCNEDEGNQQYIGQEIEMWFSIVYNGAGVFSLIVVILVQHIVDGKKRIKSVKSFILKNAAKPLTSLMSSMTPASKNGIKHTTDHTTWYMVIIPLAVYLIVFAISTLLVFFLSVPTKVFLFLTIAGLFVCGVSTAVASSGIVGTAGMFPASLGLNPFFNGQAIGGLLVSCANFVASFLDGPDRFVLQYCFDHSSSEVLINKTSVSFNNETQAADEGTTCIPYRQISLATAGYFSMGVLILAACIIGYNYIDRYKNLAKNNTFDVNANDTTFCSRDVDVHGNVEWNNHNPSQLLINCQLINSQKSYPDEKYGALSNFDIGSTKVLSSYQNRSTNVNEVRRQNSSDTDTSESTQSLTVSIWTSTRGTALSLFFTYFCTLAIFPVWTSELVSTKQCNTSSRIRNDLFVPLSFVIFNCGDVVGRYISSAIEFERISNLSSKLVWASVTRMLLFFLLFLPCETRRKQYEDWIVVEGDSYSWTVQFLFAVSNGILTNLAFCYAPTLVESRSKPQQVASAILNLTMTLGLTIGSFFSVPFLNFASGNWIFHT